MLRLTYIFIVFVFFSGRTCSVHGQISMLEHKELAGSVLKSIFNTDEIMDEILPRVPALVMLGVHLNEKRKIDSVSVQCSDTAIAAAMRKIRYDKFSVNWDFLFPQMHTEILRNKKVTLYIPTFILKDLDESSKAVFSKDDIEAALLRDESDKTAMYYLNNSILIESVEIRISKFH
ncbi:hypothetical protein [Agriterribacter sp.]|uniref:hypothetical protein n=1 Tax=Agriterribacter sp. TaxID=2821509 RepID=UPI002D043FC9|nr:hypothetical protein [Agriterribacter sp.]HRP56898.1 hypothetical protein [Agriterribacter sp.]